MRAADADDLRRRRHLQASVVQLVRMMRCMARASERNLSALLPKVAKSWLCTRWVSLSRWWPTAQAGARALQLMLKHAGFVSDGAGYACGTDTVCCRC